MKNSKNGYKSEELEKALFKVEDLFDRLQVPMFLLMQTAWDIHKGEKLNESDRVYVGIKKNNLTPFVLSTLKSLEQDGITPKLQQVNGGYHLQENGVPIDIKIVQRNYKFLDNLQFKWYKATEYWLPNPFSVYWKVRHLIK